MCVNMKTVCIDCINSAIVVIISSMKNKYGFTIVELLIVIVVIAILAAITVVAFNGIQDRARASKIKADVSNIAKAMAAAKQLTSKTIVELTSTPTIGGNNTGTGRNCWSKPNSTDLAAVPKTDKCWTDYYETLQILTDSSGIRVTGIVDPYGRPYLIDQSEGENVGGNYCVKDIVSAYRYPHVGTSSAAAYDPNYLVQINNITPGCI